MIRELILCLVVQYVAAQGRYGCPKFGQLVDESCPVQLNVDGTTQCYAMISAGAGGAFTIGSGDEICKDTYGDDAHLGDVLNKKAFEDIRCYMVEQSTIRRFLDPKVLTGMTYDIEKAKVYRYDGKVLRNAYWGERSYPLSYGTSMIMRAHETVSRSKLLNFGDQTTRYDRVLCQYPTKK